MHARLPLLGCLIWLPVTALAVDPPPAGSPDNVRIYRCVSSNGAVSLQDAPCTKATAAAAEQASKAQQAELDAAVGATDTAK